MREPTQVREPGQEYETGQSFNELVEVIARLREHCPWMGALTHAGLVEYLIEESYELVEAIETGHITSADRDALQGELGDVLLQVVLHARLQEEAGSFTIRDVVAGLTAKMIRRNPHVFEPDGSLRTAFPAAVDDIVRTWHEVKKAERPEGSPFDGIPAHLPALALAAKTLERARRAGLELDPAPDASAPHTEEDLGDLLFGIVRRAGAAGLDPERALRRAAARYRSAVTPAD